MESMAVLLRAVTLLYRESQVQTSSTTTKDLVREVCEYIKLPAAVDLDRSRDIMVGLKNLCEKLSSKETTPLLNKNSLLQDVKLCTQGRPDLYDSFVIGMDDIEGEENIKAVRNQYVKELNNYLKYNTVMTKVNDLYKSLRLSNQFNYTDKLLEMSQVIEPILTATSIEESDSNDDIILSNVSKLTDAFELAAVGDNPKLFLKVGWQWLTEQLGADGALKRGNQNLLYALQHNFKSGFTLNVFRQCIQYNPHFKPLDETKKPLLIHLSTENHLTDNLRYLYQQIKENETGEICDITHIDRREAAEFLQKWAADLGWEVSLLRRNPSEFTYRDIEALIEKFESQGYEVVGIFIDYLAMCNTRGCWTGQGGGTGMDIRALFRRCRNYFAEKKIMSFTPHQLSTGAKRELSMHAPSEFLSEIAGRGLTDSCGTIDQEADFELYIHIIKQLSGSYLSTYRGKHRGVDNTPEKDFAKLIPFQRVAAIPDDIGASRAIPRLPGSAGNSVIDW